MVTYWQWCIGSGMWGQGCLGYQLYTSFWYGSAIVVGTVFSVPLKCHELGPATRANVILI